MQTKTKVIIGGGLTALFAAAVGSVYVHNMAFGYSDGVRPGSILKVSEKGRLCKSWEGQLNMNNFGRVDGQNDQLSPYFEFSVKDEALAKKLQEISISGQQVALDYTQIKWRNVNALLTLSCPLDTEYVVTGVREANGTPIPYIMPMPNPVIPRRK